ncbi:hypothetical protein [Paenibacillus oryzisoli]|uniref:Uncharacterized protein n=1 Tax=Paenibacillus oryzisoli TaxID=1850517 RepID=A0A198AJW5_9BACL|nr:hypothetical protein [Paenibacillus oryzisoli]OAS21370.1 hypothetical protein A8708_31375 [Paenibacillus oryzisoli]
MKLGDVEGYDLLTPQQQTILERTYKLHSQAHGLDYKPLYAVEKIKRVQWDKQEKTVNVYYQHEWYHYTSDGCWY